MIQFSTRVFRLDPLIRAQDAMRSCFGIQDYIDELLKSPPGQISSVIESIKDKMGFLAASGKKTAKQVNFGEPCCNCREPLVLFSLSSLFVFRITGARRCPPAGLLSLQIAGLSLSENAQSCSHFSRVDFLHRLLAFKGRLLGTENVIS